MTPEAKVREIERRLHDSGLGGDLLLDEMQRLIIQALQAERDWEKSGAKAVWHDKRYPAQVLVDEAEDEIDKLITHYGYQFRKVDTP